MAFCTGWSDDTHKYRDGHWFVCQRIVYEMTGAGMGKLFKQEGRTVKHKKKRDIEKTYSKRAFVAKLRRLADALERGEHFTIRVAGETVRVPAAATVSIEHERGSGMSELEFQVRWPH